MAAKTKVKTKSVNPKSGITLVLTGLATVTLSFGTGLQDPFNAPKMWLLFIFGAWLVGQVISEIVADIQRKNWQRTFDWAIGVAFLFILTIFVSFLFTDVKYVGLFGEYQRRTGLLTHIFLVAFFLFTLLKVKNSEVNRIFYWVFGIALVFGFYGLLQHFGLDFVKWNNEYNSVLGTVGNPNFAAALMGIFSVILFGASLSTELLKVFRIASLIIVFTLLLTIYFSDSLQGFLAAAVGFGVLIATWIWQRVRILGWCVASFGVLGGIASVLGILQIGPFSFLYKDSITYRGDYWRAGTNMFKDHIWFGVGLDRYGAYFREYRDATQSFRRGPNVGTDAAHNVFIQLGATGGIFVLIAYLLLVGLIFWRGVIGLRNSNGNTQIISATFFGAWLTYLAQAIISIDNIGVAIWGWVLGGIVVGLSCENLRPKVRISGVGLILSSSLTLFAVIISSLFFKAEYAQHQVGKYSVPTNVAEQTRYKEIVLKSLQVKPVEINFRLKAASFFLEAGMNEDAVLQLKQAMTDDPRGFKARDALAAYYEQNKQFDLAIPIRKYLVKIDPYNAINLLALSRDLEAIGDIAGAREIIDEIAAFAPESTKLKSAKSELLS